MSKSLLYLRDIELTFGGASLFAGCDLDIRTGSRIAVVGRNGSGKSTLMKIAAGLIEADRGERFVHPAVKVRYLPQEPNLSGFETAHDAVYASTTEIADAAALANRRLDDFNIAPDLPISSASGGELKRVAIAAALASEPDILLLDEPTNHLDIATITTLESTLARADAALAVISHDRRFLETLTNETVWIDRGVTRHHLAGFEKYEAWRDAVLEEEKADLHKLGRKIAAEEDWVRYGVTARRKRNVRRMRELQTMRAQLKNAQTPDGSVKFSTTDSDSTGKRFILAENLSKQFDGRKIVENFSTVINRGEKIGIVAPNGAGKTTLIRLLTGSLVPDTGSLSVSETVDLVTLDQHRSALNPTMRLADAITDGRGDWVTAGGNKRHVASYLGDFLFKAEQWRAPVSSLSGGERGRLALAAALARPANILALDEPTNDLDLETLDLLQETLSDFAGTVLLISHDRSFLNRVVSSVITPTGEPGEWRRIPGDYDDAQKVIRAAVPKPAPSSKPKSKSTEKKPTNQRVKLSYKDQYALETLPDKIDQLSAEISALKEKLADPSLFERAPEDFKKIADKLAAQETTLEEAETQWLEISIKAEAMESQ